MGNKGKKYLTNAQTTPETDTDLMGIIKKNKTFIFTEKEFGGPVLF